MVLLLIVVWIKRGDNQILKFYMETINDNFLPDSSENMLGKSIDKNIGDYF